MCTPARLRRKSLADEQFAVLGEAAGKHDFKAQHEVAAGGVGTAGRHALAGYALLVARADDAIEWDAELPAIERRQLQDRAGESAAQ